MNGLQLLMRYILGVGDITVKRYFNVLPIYTDESLFHHFHAFEWNVCWFIS